jgi:hypothetical protein
MLLRARKLGQYIPDDIREISSALADREFTCYVVGGSLRDILRGKSAHDFDLATDAKPEQIEEIFPDTIPTGKQFGTITVKYNGNFYQMTTFRKETGYADGRHPDQIEYSKDIREDVRRRDFTINALAYNALTNELVDEFDGLEDLKNGILRAVGNPRDRFTEDGLRVLRAIRFLSVTGFTVEPETGKAMAEFCPRWLELAAKERIYEEINKTLLSENPDYGLSFLNWPLVNHLDRQVRWAAVIKDHPEVFELVQDKQKRRWIEKLLRFDLDAEKASMEIADLKIDGIDVMELGPRGEEVGHVLDTLLEIVIEKRAFNKKPILIELAKDIIAGKTAQDIFQREADRKAATKVPII